MTTGGDHAYLRFQTVRVETVAGSAFSRARLGPLHEPPVRPRSPGAGATSLFFRATESERTRAAEIWRSFLMAFHARLKRKKRTRKQITPATAMVPIIKT